MYLPCILIVYKQLNMTFAFNVRNTHAPAKTSNARFTEE